MQSPQTVTFRVPPGTTAAELQTLIDTAAAGTVLQLQAGHYHFDQTIRIARDDITVVGAGSGETVIHMPPALGAEAFDVGLGVRTGTFALVADIAAGGTAMQLSTPHTLVAGDYVYLSRDSTAAFYDAIGDTVWRNTDVPLRTSIVQVTAVDGQRITLASGVHFDFTTGETRISEISMAEHVTLGGFTVDYGLATADPALFTNTLGVYLRNAVIDIHGTAGLTLFDVIAHDVPSNGVLAGASRDLVLRGITMTGAHNKGDAGNGYAIEIRDVYDSSFTEITDRDMRHSVVFASWKTAVGNFVHVAETDRDINFHGSPDYDNVVMVDRSLRDADSDIISPILFINTDGTHYGSVTQAEANTTRFGHVVGSRLADTVTGYDNGCWLEGGGGDDRLTGGAGNDLLSGGAGRDYIIGAGGEDIVEYSGNRAAFVITSSGAGTFEVRDNVGRQSTDTLAQVEWLLFDDAVIRLADMALLAVTAVDTIFQGPGRHYAPPPVILTGTSDRDVFDVTVDGTVVHGLAGADTVRSTVSFIMNDDVERLDLLGLRAIDGTGGATASQITGNEARNVLHGMAGNDRLSGLASDDALHGGDGDDHLSGDGGNDRLDGGAGQDRLTGGAGADRFVFAAAADSARAKSDKLIDFQTGVDQIDLSAIDADTGRSGNQDFIWRTANAGAGSLWFRSGYLYGDVDADGMTDLAIYMGSATVVATDIVM